MNLNECPAWKETERVLDKLNIPYRTNQNGFVVSLMKENDININPRKTDDYVRFELKDCLKQCLEFVNSELHFERRYKSNIPGRMEYTPCVDLKNIEKFIVELNNSIDIIKNEVLASEKESNIDWILVINPYEFENIYSFHKMTNVYWIDTLVSINKYKDLYDKNIYKENMIKNNL